MTRTLLVPLVATALLAGCATGNYAYRGGSGDYYYGRPQVEYRYHYPYGYGPYGYGPYGSFRYGYGHPYRYGQPYWGPYGYGGYGWPYHGHPGYYRPRPTTPRPDPNVPRHDDDHPPPWRDLDRRRRTQIEGGRPPAMPVPDRAVAPRRDDGSRMEQVMRRAQERAREQAPLRVREDER